MKLISRLVGALLGVASILFNLGSAQATGVKSEVFSTGWVQCGGSTIELGQSRCSNVAGRWTSHCCRGERDRRTDTGVTNLLLRRQGIYGSAVPKR